MNRTIKFRGKRLDNGAWVYGGLLQVCGGYIIYHGSQTESDEFEDDGKTAIYLYKNEVSAVHPESVGQFTGLLDRNGKEIYEGDIIKMIDSLFHNENISSVIFEDGTFGVHTKYLNKLHPLCLTEETYNDGQWSDNMGYSYEVIGNIHDNPELLHPIKP